MNFYCNNFSAVENYELAKADNFEGWVCHHRLETHNSDGEERLVQLEASELKALGMYYDRPPEEFIFMKRKDHAKLHKIVTWHKNCNRRGTHFKMPEGFSKIASERMLGDKNPMKRPEQRKRQSERMKIAAKGNTNNKGKHWKLVNGKRIYY